MSGLTPMGKVSGPSGLLEGLGALANAVPGYFQGRQIAEQEQDRKREIAAQTLPFLVQRLKANPSDPDAIKSLGQIYGTLGLGSVPTIPGQTPAAAPIAPDSALATQTPEALTKQAQNPATEQAFGGVPTIRTPGPEQANLSALGAAPTAQDFISQNLDKLTQMQESDRNPQQIAALMRASGIQDPTDQDVAMVMGLPVIPNYQAQQSFLKDFNPGLAEAAKNGPGAVKAFVAENAPLAEHLGLPPLNSYITPEMIQQMTATYTANLNELTARAGLSEAQKKVLLAEAPGIIKKNLAEANLDNVKSVTSQEMVGIAQERLSISLAREQRLSSKQATTASSLTATPQGRATATALSSELRSDITHAQADVKAIYAKLGAAGVIELATNPNDPAVAGVKAQLQQYQDLINSKQQTLDTIETKLAAGIGLNLPSNVKPLNTGKNPFGTAHASGSSGQPAASRARSKGTVSSADAIAVGKKQGWTPQESIARAKQQGYTVTP